MRPRRGARSMALARAFASSIVILAFLGAVADAEAGSGDRKRKGRGAPQPCPEKLESRWFAAARPAGTGWLVAPAPAGSEEIRLVRDGAGDPGGSPDDTWAAQLMALPSSGTTTPQDLGFFLEREYRDAIVSSPRFKLRDWSVEPETTRGVPCVRYRLASVDRQAFLANGRTGELVTDERGLACQVATPRPAVTIVKMSRRAVQASGPPTDVVLAPFEQWLASVRLVGATGATTSAPAAGH